MLVPNKFPTKTTTRRIAIIGECPGQQETAWHTCGKCAWQFATQWRDERGHHTTDRCTKCFATDIASTPTPFVGPSGWLLNKLLAGVGIDREACFVGNVCQVQPPGNEISRFKWHGDEIQGGLAQLRRDLKAFDPHFCLLLGNTPLRAFKAVLSEQPKVNISDWRGSLFESYLPQRLVERVVDGEVRRELKPTKCMATYHPAALLREAGLTGVARFDFARAAEESRTDVLEVPADVINVDWTKEQLLYALDQLRTFKMKVAVDLEGGCGGVSCIGFAIGANEAFVVPFIKADGTSYWDDPEDEVALWQAVADVLTDSDVPKVLQNYLYDAFVLAWSYGILIRGLADDIMLKHFELYAEFEKSLGFQTSIYTRHPFYKFERKSDDERVQLTYCGKDCCRTYECNEAQDRQLMPKQREHYRTNVALLAPILYMELRGIRFDVDEAQRRLAATTKRIYALQDRINREAAASRTQLAAFYAALEAAGVAGTLPPANYGVVVVEPKQPEVVLGGAECDTRSTGLVQILRDAFCVADPAEWRDVEEHFYEPQRWNGKKWCKAGKRIPVEVHEAVEAACKAGAWQGSQAPTLQATDKGATWLKPASKVVNRRVKVEIRTLGDVRRYCRDSVATVCRRAIDLAGKVLDDRAPAKPALTPAERGELATLLGLSVKINATGQGGDAQWFLYEHAKLPKQFIKEGNRLTDRLASDDEACLTAYLKSGKTAKARDRRAIWFLTLRRLVTITKFLTATADADGRMRFAFNLVGTPTGRMAAYGSPTGTSDINPQTITKKLRDLYVADDGCDLGQFDLDGSDSYSVAAYCASLGDRTMLDDNLARIKPAKVLALIYERGSSVNQLSRDALKAECKKVDGEGWLYFACKRILHGSNYGMKKLTMSAQILTDSYKLTGKPIYVEPAVCERIQEQAFFVRYPGVRRWHEYMARELKEKGFILCCNGFKRSFYGRKDEHSTLKEALAHTPQVLTTHAILLTMQNMWNDPDNRRADGSLRIEPLLLVHDSILTQWRQVDRDFAKVKMAAWFQHKLHVNGVEFTIPANGGGGPNWLHQGSEKWAKKGGFDI